MGVSTGVPLSVCDAGDVACFEDYGYRDGRRVLVEIAREVVMVVEAPRGRMVLFKPSDECDPYYGSFAPHSWAVKTFMEQHRDD